MEFTNLDNNSYIYFGLDAMYYGLLTLNHTPKAKFGYSATPHSIIFKSFGSFTDLSPSIWFSVIAHSTMLVRKLHGQGIECIYLIPSEGGLLRSGIFFNVSTRKTISRRSFSPSNEVPFDLFISKDEKRKLLEFEDEDESYDDRDLNEPPNDDVEEFQANAIESDDPVPYLVSDSESDENDKTDSEKHSWNDVSLSSHTTQQKNKFDSMIDFFFPENDKRFIVPYVWKIDGFFRPVEDPGGPLYFRYFNAKFPRT